MGRTLKSSGPPPREVSGGKREEGHGVVQMNRGEKLNRRPSRISDTLNRVQFDSRFPGIRERLILGSFNLIVKSNC